MTDEAILARLTVLGHPQRLSVFRLLMRHCPNAVAAGDLARATGLKNSTLSVYLAALRKAGLIEQSKSGAARLYRAAPDALGEVALFLLNDCLMGRAGMVAPATARGEPLRVLFLGTGNSARSILAEALFNRLAGPRGRAASAGIRPDVALHPIVAEVLRAKGLGHPDLQPKAIDLVQGALPFDAVITLSDEAANADLSPWPGIPVVCHWRLPDPDAAGGGVIARALAFQSVLDGLNTRIAALLNMGLETMARPALQDALDALSSDLPEDARVCVSPPALRRRSRSPAPQALAAS